MKKLLLKSFFVLTAFSGLITTQTNAQNSWEFKDAATGTNVWDDSQHLSSPVQKSNSVVYTTTTGNNPRLMTTNAGIDAGAADFSDATTVKARRLMAITMRIGAGGPDYFRVIHPKTGGGDF